MSNYISSVLRNSKVIHIIDEIVAEGVNVDGVNCRVRQFIVYERMEAEENPPDLGIHVNDGIEPKMKRA
jgi:hypothetical protein